MKVGVTRLWWPRHLIAFLPFLAGLATASNAQDHPDQYALDADEFSWWKTESRVLVEWRNDKPVMSGLECSVRHDRYLQDGKPPLEIAIVHPVESAEYRFGFTFNLGDTKLISRTVETITVGGRPYQRKIIQSRIIPAFGAYQPGDIILSYGIGRDMFRPNENYPWLPVEFLIPQFFEVEGIVLGVAGDFQIEHGEYEKRYEEIYIDMDGFKEAVQWCYEQVNPADESKIVFPPELSRKLKQ